jgi:hypothetical protein
MMKDDRVWEVPTHAGCRRTWVADAVLVAVEKHGDEWEARCVDHRRTVTYPTFDAAEEAAANPEGWCDMCATASIAGVPGLRKAWIVNDALVAVVKHSDKWAAWCVDHHRAAVHPTFDAAEEAAANPERWCDVCAGRRRVD